MLNPSVAASTHHMLITVTHLASQYGQRLQEAECHVVALLPRINDALSCLCYGAPKKQGVQSEQPPGSTD